MNNSLQYHIQRNKAATILRQLAEPYLRTNKVHDHRQGEVLLNIADDIISGDLAQAAVRFDALHANIKRSLPFEILDLIDKGETILNND